MKKLMYLAAVIAAGLFLVSCSGASIKPSGDPEKDAKALMDYQFQATKDIQEAFGNFELSKAKKIGEDMEKVSKQFEDFYAKNADLKDKFDAARSSLSGEYEKKLEEMGQGLVDALGGIFSDTEKKADEAVETVEEAAEAVEDVTE